MTFERPLPHLQPLAWHEPTIWTLATLLYPYGNRAFSLRCLNVCLRQTSMMSDHMPDFYEQQLRAAEADLTHSGVQIECFLVACDRLRRVAVTLCHQRREN